MAVTKKTIADNDGDSMAIISMIMDNSGSCFLVLRCKDV